MAHESLTPPTAPCALPDSPLAAARAGLDRCVHCGFCLPACPTYLALEDENDSPRGRLLLMGALLEGTVAPDDAIVGQHLDRCLGCRGCETACPSGVPYGHLLEATRATVAAYRPIPILGRLLLWGFAREWVLRPALMVARLVRDLGIARGLARGLPARFAMPFAMLASTARPGRTPGATPNARGTNLATDRSSVPSRGTASLLTGCVMEGLFTAVNRATERTLTRNGWAMRVTAGQRCCGALHAHAGDVAGARALARANIAAFESSGAETIVLNSAGCGAMCKAYGDLLADDPAWAERAVRFADRVRDVSELLAAAGPAAPGGAAQTPSRAASIPVAYDAPCHLQHAQRVVDPPLALLRAASHIRLVPLAESDQCCGSAGIFNLIQPEVATRVLAPKLDHIAASGAQVVATGNPGCLMQIGGGLVLAGRAVTARHPVELLDEAYEREGTRR
ncbi:MAG: heterodisulfide reductase-related iron-sulfur binding cluster [Gemmatimonadaceae bacterium]|jgi:glycolate oxidase iron-sulfur subunit